MHSLDRSARFLAATLLLIAMAMIAATSASAHREGESRVPEMASELSDPRKVHQDLENAGIGWYPDYQVPATGCWEYNPKFDPTTGDLAELVPALDFCATDRISMFQHTVECGASYALYCVEPVMPPGYLTRNAGFSIYGVLYRSGQPAPAREFFLERMVLGIQSAFSPYGKRITASSGEIGSVRFNDRARSKTAFRWGVVNDAGVLVYSTLPVVTNVKPRILSATINDRTVRRQQLFLTTVRTDVPIYGTVKLEYRFGNRWIQINRKVLSGSSRFIVKGRIDRTSGAFPVRITLQGMSQPGRPWYDETTRPLGSVKVNSVWTIVR